MSETGAVQVVLIAPLAEEARAKISAVDRRLTVHDAWELFGPELVLDWPTQTVRWYLPARFQTLSDSDEQRQRRTELLAMAEVICIAFPPPLHIVSRAPNLRFVHQMPAGVSNLMRTDLWRSRIPVTSGRGAGSTLPIAEWAIAAMMALLKDFPRAFVQRRGGQIDRRAFRGRQIAGSTLGVIGLGGIGREVARLGQALGMRVVGTRRSAESVPNVEALFGPSELSSVLTVSDVVVVAAQLTTETHHVLNEAALGVMKRGALLINVARGELIDESALLAALRSGHLGGFAADVYEGEFDHPPPAALLALDNVLFTPHTSGQTQYPRGGALEIFRQNLSRSLVGEPLLNEVNWDRGY